MTSRRSRHIRAMGRAFMALCWLAVIAMAAEVAERTRTGLGNRHFPRMFEERFDEALGVRFERQPAQPAPPPMPGDAGPADENALPRPSIPEQTLPAAADAADAAVQAAARGETHFRVDDGGNLLEAYGEPAFELHLQRVLTDPSAPGALRRVLAEKLAAGTRFETEYDFYFSPIRRHYRLTGTPEADGFSIVARDRTHVMPAEDLNRAILPPDSEWLVHLHAYKPNWQRPGRDERTNNFGFRDHDVVAPKPEGVFRIVCIGGSTTEEGADLGSTYPKQVERILRERVSENIEVINAGVVGATSFTIRTRMADYLAMEPDLLVYYGGVNEISHNFMEVWLDQRSGGVRILERSHALRRLFNRRLLPDDDALRGFLRRTTLRNLAAVRLLARESGADLIVCSFATPDPAALGWKDRSYLDANVAATWGGQGLVHYRTWRHALHLLNEELRAWSGEDDGPAYLPVAEHFVGGAETFYDTCHATAAGMTEKARVVAHLLEAYLEPRSFSR